MNWCDCACTLPDRTHDFELPDQAYFLDLNHSNLRWLKASVQQIMWRITYPEFQTGGEVFVTHRILNFKLEEKFLVWYLELLFYRPKVCTQLEGRLAHYMLIPVVEHWSKFITLPCWIGPHNSSCLWSCLWFETLTQWTSIVEVVLRANKLEIVKRSFIVRLHRGLSNFEGNCVWPTQNVRSWKK